MDREMQEWNSDLGNISHSIMPLCRPQTTPSRHLQVLVLQHSVFKAGSDP